MSQHHTDLSSTELAHVFNFKLRLIVLTASLIAVALSTRAVAQPLEPQPTPAQPVPAPPPQPAPPQPAPPPPTLDSWELEPVSAAPEAGFSPISPSPTQSFAGAVDLALSTELLSYLSTSTTFDGSDFEADDSSVSWGVAEPAIELAYGVSNRVLVGGQLQFGGVSTTSKTTEASSVAGSSTNSDSSFGAIQIGPKLELLFPSASRWIPFVGANAAVRFYNIKDGSDFSATTFRIGATAGLRFVALDHVSIDPMVYLAGFFGSHSTSVSGEEQGDGDYSGVDIGLRIRLSVWL